MKVESDIASETKPFYVVARMSDYSDVPIMEVFRSEAITDVLFPRVDPSIPLDSQRMEINEQCQRMLDCIYDTNGIGSVDRKSQLTLRSFWTYPLHCVCC